jgi:protein gp37
MAKRFPKTFGDFNDIQLHPDRLNEPQKWRKPCMVFVVSMGDLFHKDVPLDFIQEVFKVMNECQRHTFQVLTKRPERLLELSPNLTWTDNIWAGVSIENSDYLYRMDLLRETDAKVKWLSLEPLLSALPNMNLSGINWVVVGGESGRNARPMLKEWVIDIRNQCQDGNM